MAENRKASQTILSDSYFAGKQVFESREYAVDFSASPIDQLSRERQTGDYFLYCKDRQTLVYDADFDDFMPVNDVVMESKYTGSNALLDGRANMPLLSSGTSLPVNTQSNDRDRMSKAGFSAQQIDQVLNCARCFQLAHLMHSSAAAFAADLKATPTDTLSRASISDSSAMNMAVESDRCVTLLVISNANTDH